MSGRIDIDRRIVYIKQEKIGASEVLSFVFMVAAGLYLLRHSVCPLPIVGLVKFIAISPKPKKQKKKKRKSRCLVLWGVW